MQDSRYLKHDKGLSRREFLSKAGRTGLAAGVGFSLEGLLSSCATVEVAEKDAVVYPELAGKKIQPPKNGCLVGLHRYNFSHDTGRIIDYYQQILGNKPAFFGLCCDIDFSYFPQTEMAGLVSRGVIPNVFPDYKKPLEDIARGSYDADLTTVAKEATKYGNQHGGFFYTPMRHPNGRPYPWFGNPNEFKKAWNHVWQIFQDNGANEYTTWIWEVATNEGYCGAADPASIYYPDDEKVDWIGFTGYSRAMSNCTRDKSYNQLITAAYHEMRRTHPDKPIMQAEFGTTQGSDQPRWVQSAYKTIKSLPGMKAALYWDNPGAALNDNLYLSKESYEVLKEILKDPYWITAKSN